MLVPAWRDAHAKVMSMGQSSEQTDEGTGRSMHRLPTSLPARFQPLTCWAQRGEAIIGRSCNRCFVSPPRLRRDARGSIPERAASARIRVGQRKSRYAATRWNGLTGRCRLRRSVRPAFTGSSLASIRSAAMHLHGQLIVALAQINDVPQQTVRRPLDIADLDDHFGPYPMDPAKHRGDPNRVPRGGDSARSILSTTKG